MRPSCSARSWRNPTISRFARSTPTSYSVARGELIALELAGDVTRARTLFDRHASVWWRELVPRRIATRPGFVERVADDMSELVSAVWMFGNEPIRDVEVVGIPPHPVQQFDLTRVHPRRLALHGYGYGRDAVAKLIAAGATRSRRSTSRARSSISRT